MQVGARMSQKSDASLLISRFLMMQKFSLLHILSGVNVGPIFIIFWKFLKKKKSAKIDSETS